jgi:hypothetical protein
VSGAVRGMTERERPRPGKNYGLVSDADGSRIWVFTWADVIEDAGHRLKFVKELLTYQPDADRISPLVQEAPTLAPPRGGIDPSIQDAYREPTRLEDETSNRVLAGYAVDQLVISSRRMPPLLGLAYADFPARVSEVMRWEIKGSFLDFQTPVPRVVSCIGWHAFLKTPRLSRTLSGLRAKIAAAVELRCR